MMTKERIRDADQTRQRILVAAEDQFALKGFYGARIDDIAKQAKINKRMIYAYFGNKEALYKKVLYHVYQKLDQAEKEILDQHLEGRELISAIIHLYFDFLQKNPNFVSILMWENLNKAADLKQLPKEDLKRELFDVIREEIKKGQVSGIFRPLLDAEQVTISLILVCFANFSNSYTMSCLFGRDLTSQAAIEEREKQTMDMVLSWLCGN